MVIPAIAGIRARAAIVVTQERRATPVTLVRVLVVTPVTPEHRVTLDTPVTPEHRVTLAILALGLVATPVTLDRAYRVTPAILESAVTPVTAV